MTKLIILRGPSGSGKSTWAKNQNAAVISRDDFRKALFPNFSVEEYYKSPILHDMEESVSRVEKAAIASLLKAGKDVISDNTYIEWKYVNRMANFARSYGAEVEIKIFDVRLPVAIAADRHRGMNGGRHVGEDIITRQHGRFQGTKEKKLDPWPELIPYEPQKSLTGVWLCDIDGTVAHMRDYRGPFDWLKVHLDDKDESVLAVINSLILSGESVIFFSGRDSAARDLTEDWLSLHIMDFNPKNLYMRAAGDMRPDNIIKLELFNDVIRGKYNVKGVFDDRAQVVRMWKQLGLKVFNVSGIDEGEF